MHNNLRQLPFLPKHSGFTLIEVLVSIVIISLGLLGVASMQYVGLRDSNRSAERSQATILAYDIADRMRMNSRAVQLGQYLIDADSPPAIPSGSPANFCLTGFCDSTQMAAADAYSWFIALGQALPMGLGEITCIDSDATDADTCSAGSVHLITIMWDEQRQGVTGTDCSGDLSVDRLCLNVDVQI